jgi:hypothetical protein
VFNYVAGLLRAIPPLYEMIEVERADEIELNNRVVIMVKTSDYRAIRGLRLPHVFLTKSLSGTVAAYRLTVRC